MRITKEQRKILKNVRDLRRQQIKEFEKFTIGYKEDIKLIDLVMKGQKDIRVFINHSEQLRQYSYGLGGLNEQKNE